MNLLQNYHDRRFVKNLESLTKNSFEWEVKRDVVITLQDGCKIAADMYFPISDKPLPTLFAASAYGKDPQTMDSPQQPPESMTFDHMVEAGNIPYFVSRGYNYVVIDLRGVGKSDGEWHGFYSEQDQRDCSEVIDWISQQKWSDGNVGMMGHSYFGVMQLLTAAYKPKALKAIAPIESFTDFFDRARPGGITSSWYWFLLHYCAAHTPLLASELRYDAETLKKIIAEEYQSPDYNKNTFYVREFNAPKKDAPFFDLLLHSEKGDFWDERSPRAKFNDVDIPVYSGGFWGYYTYVDGAFDAFTNKNLDVHKRVGILSYGTGGATKLPLKHYDEELLRWYEHWLRGIDTGILDEPPIKIYVMGSNKYRFEHEWPLSRTVWTKLFLKRYGELSSIKDSDGDQAPDVLVHSPSTVTIDYAPLEFETAPLDETVELTGPLSLTLYASIDCEDANFVAQLFDEAPDGNRVFLTKAYLKASHRELDIENSSSWNPVHTHKAPTPVQPGEIIEYKLSFSPISNRFSKGHRIVLTVNSTDAVLFEKNHSHGLGAVIEDKMPPMGILPSANQIIYKIYRDEKYESHLLAPVIPIESTSEDLWVQPIDSTEIRI